MDSVEAATDPEREHHAISELAGESGRPLDVVAAVYRAELARLKEDASIHDFLPVLAARRTREALRGSEPPAMQASAN